MRRFKQVKRKEVVFDLKEWSLIERKAAKAQLNTTEYIRRLALENDVVVKDFSNLATLLQNLKKVGANINQLAKKANEINSIYATDYETMKGEYAELCRTLSASVLDHSFPQLEVYPRPRKNGRTASHGCAQLP